MTVNNPQQPWHQGDVSTTSNHCSPFQHPRRPIKLYGHSSLQSFVKKTKLTNGNVNDLAGSGVAAAAAADYDIDADDDTDTADDDTSDDDDDDDDDID